MLTTTALLACPSVLNRATVASHLTAVHTALSQGNARPAPPRFHRTKSSAVVIPLLNAHYNDGGAADVATLGITVVARCGEEGFRRRLATEIAIPGIEKDSSLHWDRGRGKWRLIVNRPAATPLLPPPLPDTARLLSRCVRLLVCLSHMHRPMNADHGSTPPQPHRDALCPTCELNMAATEEVEVEVDTETVKLRVC